MKDVLENEYTTYFLPTPMPMSSPTSSAPTSSDPTHAMDLLEFLHYTTVLMDRQIINHSAFKNRKEAHIHNLLSHLEEFYNHESIQFC